MTSPVYPRVYAFICGHHTIPKERMIAGTTGLITIPIPAFVIEHPTGLFVFDTGFNRLVYEDVASYFPAEALKPVEFHFSPEEELPTQMRNAGFDPDSVRLVANSHLHYDHCGGNVLFPQATVMVQRDEWEAASNAPADKAGYRKVDFHTGQTMDLVEGERDVFGDGSVVLTPTIGHTPGHQSLHVRHAGGVAVLAGDACYMADTLTADDKLPDISVTEDPESYLRSLESLRALHRSGSLVFVGHDPDFWSKQPLAPKPLLG
ncbi:N-acyl homoserine lactonase family protein [Arthrobacter sp. AK01]|uniref:N-acyl homoserine lactonase family protein n=1 Tax=Arthrobacter sp. AK01 TaxID=2894084 RepID=UPI001E53EDCD|nr:N-acyl homoserine lactonase family protein [Arthrobacter sp. AK01]MCD4853694.1 N-acyl homoserine lactonase family protein [Arthrobacter sp. AK01]